MRLSRSEDERTRLSSVLRAIEYIAIVPGLIALIVGLLYTIGAVVWAAQLRDAGQTLRDVLPLIPLPQLLARGIEAGFIYGPLAVVALANVILLTSLFWRLRDELLERPTRRIAAPDGHELWLPSSRLRKERAAYGRTGSPALVRRGYIVLVASLVVVALLFAIVRFEWPVMLTLPFMIAFIFYTRRLTRRRSMKSLRRGIGAMTIFGVFAIGSSVAYDVVLPRPLPRVAVHEPGNVVRGRLLVQSDGIVAVGVAEKRYVAVPVRRVERVEVTATHRRMLPSFFELATGNECLEVIVLVCKSRSD